MSQPIIYVELGKVNPLILKFQLRNTPLASRWLAKWHASRQCDLDDPTRFYGFNTVEQEIKRAEKEIRQCISTINSFEPIIHRPFTSVHDQDILNYLHNIFERYHGLLDQQQHEFWIRSPEPVRQALAKLNVLVHRCETAARPQQPRAVCTWYGLPKTDTLTLEEMQQYGEIDPGFGSMYFCYVEIGKTLEDLTHDLDNYISDEAFKPFNFYSVDFVMKFSESSDQDISEKLQNMKNYYSQHQKFFYERELNNFNDPRLLPLKFPFADLIFDQPKHELVDCIKEKQYVNKVYVQ